jgi:hypothetical protein
MKNQKPKHARTAVRRQTEATLFSANTAEKDYKLT